jgi:hypothetical protein
MYTHGIYVGHTHLNESRTPLVNKNEAVYAFCIHFLYSMVFVTVPNPLYLDDLLLKLRSDGIRCYWGNHFVDSLAYADDDSFAGTVCFISADIACYM